MPVGKMPFVCPDEPAWYSDGDTYQQFRHTPGGLAGYG